MQYHLIFSTDRNYLPFLFVLCQSIFDHVDPSVGSSQDEFVFNVLTDDSIDIDKAIANAQSFLESNQNCGVSAKFEWHVVEANQFSGFNKMIRENNVSYTTYYRLIIDRLISQEVERAVYLDIDMLVVQDIRKLFLEYPLDGKVLGVVVDPGVHNESETRTGQDPFIYAHFKDDPNNVISIPKKTYFNAGMLLINLVEWRKQNIGSECLDLAGKLNLQYHDQDLLNIVCKDRVELLSMAWNYQGPMFYVLYNPATGKYDIADAINQHVHWLCDTPSAEEFEKASYNPSIIHFTGLKPWYQTNFLEFQLFWEYEVSPSARFNEYRSLWLNTSAKIQGIQQPHNVNADAISIDTLDLLTINRKRRKDRKTLTSFLAVSLVLNVIALIHTFFF